MQNKPGKPTPRRVFATLPNLIRNNLIYVLDPRCSSIYHCPRWDEASIWWLYASANVAEWHSNNLKYITRAPVVQTMINNLQLIIITLLIPPNSSAWAVVTSWQNHSADDDFWWEQFCLWQIWVRINIFLPTKIMMFRYARNINKGYTWTVCNKWDDNSSAARTWSIEMVHDWIISHKNTNLAKIAQKKNKIKKEKMQLLH